MVDFHTLTEHFERVHTRRLALRQIALADSWPLFQATGNPLFNKSLLWEQPGDETLVIERVDAIVESARRGRLTAMSAVVKATGEWVSLYRFQPYAANPKFLEMGIWTHDKFWHGRYSLELVRGCIDAAFDLFDIQTLVGAASLVNRSSCKLMELSGMTPTKLVYRQNEAKSEVELQEFEITRAAWAARRGRPLFEHVPLQARPITPRTIEQWPAMEDDAPTLIEAQRPAEIALHQSAGRQMHGRGTGIREVRSPMPLGHLHQMVPSLPGQGSMSTDPAEADQGRPRERGYRPPATSPAPL